jgi:predicted small integral membrane protein
MDLPSFADLNIRDLRSLGYEIVSTSLNATLSGMQAWEVVYVDANRTMALQYSTIQGDRSYTVLYGSQESTFDKFLPIARDMITSFTIAQ